MVAMLLRSRYWVLCGFAEAILACSSCVGQVDERADFFEKSIRPLLLERCIECHGPDKQEMGVRLDQRQTVLEGMAGEKRLVVPGKPEESRIWSVLQHGEDEIAMPPAGKLSAEELGKVEAWIREGAVWPDHSTLEADAQKRAEQWRQHWAFQPIRKPELPQSGQNVAPVDSFIRRELVANSLSPSAPANAHVLIRRYSFALTGLPPEPAEVTAGEKAAEDGQWTAWRDGYVDRLLASPHFGERWARYWMDVSRYADTKGYVFTEDREYKEAWKYREWVINAFNSDLPYDEFLKRQLSADRMTGSDDPAQLAAMGFLTLGRRFLNNPHDIIDDRIDVVTRGLMGLTVTCSRCHDHKFDPITMGDYYSLYGVFASSEEPKNEPSTLRMVDREKPVEPVIFKRGNPGNRGDRVPRRFLTALSSPDQAPFQDGSGRRELAEAIASRSNPLTARVFVNRVWAVLFGRGFVDTPSDFGVRTERPVHADLLDYLAADFMEKNWSVKSLVKQIVLSDTWQQSSAGRPDAEQADPENRLLCRMNRTRLDFEAHRDAVVAVSGRLDRRIGGESADLANDPNVIRRAMYARIDRQNLPGIFRTFDLASPDTHAPRRFQTTTPQQALFQLNNDFLMNRAADVAQRVTKDQNDPESRVRSLFLTVLQRQPSANELREAAAMVQKIELAQKAGVSPGWTYGYGELTESEGLRQFHPMVFAREGRLSPAEQVPDSVHGWSFVNRTGGHPGNNPDHAVVRRWTAETKCRILLHGVLNHTAEQGDGVRLRVSGPDHRIVAEVSALNSTAPFAVNGIDMEPGQSIDFVTDCVADTSHDSFKSRFVVTQSVDGKVLRVWNSEDDFREQPQQRLDAWAQLAQVLLLTNEFVFVD